MIIYFHCSMKCVVFQEVRGKRSAAVHGSSGTVQPSRCRKAAAPCRRKAELPLRPVLRWVFSNRAVTGQYNLRAGPESASVHPGPETRIHAHFTLVCGTHDKKTRQRKTNAAEGAQPSASAPGANRAVRLTAGKGKKAHPSWCASCLEQAD